MQETDMTPRELYERFQGKKCKRFPKDAKSKELKDAHRIKMEMKAMMRRNRPAEDAGHIGANISVHNENYGETMQENMTRMLEKNS